MQFPEFSHFTDQNIFEKFFSNSGIVQIAEDKIIISLKKKRHLPHLLTVMKKFVDLRIPWLESKESTRRAGGFGVTPKRG
ncbi:MAG: hypothetical protein GY797_32920 [Deltaproteobacteria bacterium]|nr:hypothetical protein [Deltaproteobacteria bacterium]